jgi:NADP-dependent 3-hydroxy acid dehydrogenase YdfG
MPGTDRSRSPVPAASGGPHSWPSPGSGRVAVVTGASSGIGAATAARLAADGFDVVLGARRLDRLTALADSIGARAQCLDVTDPASVEAFAGSLQRVDVLVNNAGGAFDVNAVADADLDSWAGTYEVNVLGTVRLTKALLPRLRASGAGDVVFVSSTAGLISYEGGPPTPRPSTGCTRWPRRCDWSCAGNLSGSSKSRRGWCTPRSSR